MYLTVPTNWDERLLDLYSAINSDSEYSLKIGQVYGCVNTMVGNGRMETEQLPEDVLKRYITNVHEMRLPFNFLLNAPSLRGQDHDRRERSALIDTILWIRDLGVDIITVSSPFLGEIIQYHCKGIKIKISTIVDVKSIQALKLLEPLGPGISGITLSYNVNRDFPVLRAMVQSVNFELELLANIMCLLNCPYQWYHYDLVGSYSQTHRCWNPPFDDYRPLGCDRVRLQQVSEVIKTPWIRPEDTPVYESIGIHAIKLAGRTMPTELIAKIVTAYAKRSYEGNLWDLIAPWIPIQVSNRALEGFIDFFVRKKVSCSSQCGTCRYCDLVAKKSVALKLNSDDYLADLEVKLAARLDEEIIP